VSSSFPLAGWHIGRRALWGRRGPGRSEGATDRSAESYTPEDKPEKREEENKNTHNWVRRAVYTKPGNILKGWWERFECDRPFSRIVHAWWQTEEGTKRDFDLVSTSNRTDEHQIKRQCLCQFLVKYSERLVRKIRMWQAEAEETGRLAKSYTPGAQNRERSIVCTGKECSPRLLWKRLIIRGGARKQRRDRWTNKSTWRY
jgi:hypothetical protein